MKKSRQPVSSNNRTEAPTESAALVPTLLVTAASVAVIVLAASSFLRALPAAMLVILRDLSVAVAIFISGYGFGRLALRPFLKDDENQPMPAPLKIAISTALGTTALSTAMLICGTLIAGGLNRYLWIAVTLAGLVAAVAPLAGKQIALTVPKKVTLAKTLLCIALAIASALWLAGAVMPPGKIGVIEKDFYDVESYHMQLPREYFDNGRITATPHNTYSNYPLAGEMLFLEAMCLYGDSWSALYAAKLTHGLWAVVAALAIYSIAGATRRGKITAALLFICSPMVIYLSWLSFVELAQCAFAAIAIALLVRMAQAERISIKTVILLGATCGASCCFKYLSVGFILLPVILLAAVICFLSARKTVKPASAMASAAAKTIVFGLVALAAMGPWLVRNICYTGNPVFPLATDLLGSGHWTPDQQARWDAGHHSLAAAQVPAAITAAITNPRGFGYVISLAAAAGLVMLAFKKRSRASDSDTNGSNTAAAIAAAMLCVQLGVWIFATHMPVRFMAPALAAAVVLAAAALARMSEKHWQVAILLCVVTLFAQSIFALRAERVRLAQQWPQPWALTGLDGHDLQNIAMQQKLGAEIFKPGVKLLLLGDVRPLYFPAGTLYASAWEAGPVVQSLEKTGDATELIATLKTDFGITHILLNKAEIARLKSTYGWWDQINAQLIEQMKLAGVKSIDISQQANDRSVAPVELLKLP